MLTEDYKKAFELSVHFGSKMKPLKPVEAIKFYYKLALAPLILAILLFASLSLLSVNSGYQRLEGIGIIALYISLPALLFATAAVYQLFAKKLLHIWSNSYEHTLTAVVYGMIPFIFFGWAFLLPVIAIVFMLAVSVWGFVVLVVAMARLQNVSIAKSFIGIFASQLVLSIIVAVLILGLKPAGLLGPSLLQNATTRRIVINMTSGPSVSNLPVKCSAQPGFACQNALFYQGSIFANVSQTISPYWSSAQFVMVSRGQSPSGSVLSSPVYGGMSSGAVKGVIIPSEAKLYKGVPFNGTIYVLFQNSSQSSQPSEAIFAYVSFTPNSNYTPSNSTGSQTQPNTYTTSTTVLTTAPTITISQNGNFSCGNFDVATYEHSYTEKGICNWTGGELWIKVGAGSPGYISYTITGLSDGKVYISNSTTDWCGIGYGPVYLPAQGYVVKISTGHGGGSCPADNNMAYVMLYANKTKG